MAERESLAEYSRRLKPPAKTPPHIHIHASGRSGPRRSGPRRKGPRRSGREKKLFLWPEIALEQKPRVRELRKEEIDSVGGGEGGGGLLFCNSGTSVVMLVVNCH